MIINNHEVVLNYLTDQELFNFYLSDNKKYSIKHNKRFLAWLSESIKDGYDLKFSLEELQIIINDIASFYSDMYSKHSIELHEIDQLITKEKINASFSNTTINLLFPKYKGNIGLSISEYNEKLNTKTIYELFSIEDMLKKNTLVFRVNAETGIVESNCKYYGMTLEEVEKELNIEFYNNKTNIDYCTISQGVYNYKMDLELRRRILELVALKLCYSTSNRPEINYVISEHFIDTMNKLFEDDILKYDEVDYIMYRCYENMTYKEKTDTKTYFKYFKLKWDIKNQM